MAEYYFFRTCVDWPRYDVNEEGGLCDMIHGSIDITRRTFMAHASHRDLYELERQLGYAEWPAQGLMMASDWMVTYHRSTLHGRRVYYFCHSGIEHVFTPNGRLR